MSKMALTTLEEPAERFGVGDSQYRKFDDFYSQIV
jgi:hypothetical protein